MAPFKTKKKIWIYIIAAIASLGGLLAGFDMGVISGALLYIKADWPMSPFLQGWLVSSAIVGSMIGAAANGILSDLYGRKKIIIATSLLFIIASVMCGYAPSLNWLIFSRILIGIAVGMVTFVVPLYISEISPQKIRGKLVSLFQLAITVGILFSYLINRLFANSEYNWRFMLAAGLIPALVLFIGICFLHDTPRWLLSKNRENEAKLAFAKILPPNQINRQIEEIKSTFEISSSAAEHHTAFRSWMLKPVLIGIGIMVMQICTGINTVIYYTTTIFQVSGFSSNIGAIYATIGIGFVNFIMTLVAIAFADKLGRKPLLYIGLSGMLISLLSLSFAFGHTTTLGDSLRWIAIGSVAVYIASFAMSLGPVGWILVSEILPLKIRGFAMSLCTVANFSFNFLVVLSFLPLINSIGESWTFLIFAGVCILSIFFVRSYVPETKGISLEEIEKSWQKSKS